MEEKYDYEVLEYIKDHPLPDNKEDMSPEQYVIRSVIDDYIHDFEYYINQFYFELSLYIICQDDYDAFGICNHVTKILEYYDHLDLLMYAYFYEDSQIHLYCDLHKIIEDAFNDNNYDYSIVTNYNIDKYRELVFDNRKEDIYQMLKEDTRTEEAKKYFNERKPE